MYSLLLKTNPSPLTLLGYHCLCCLFCWKRSKGFICQNFSLSCIGEGNGKPLWCTCLENPRDRGAWWPDVYGVAQSRTQLKRLSSSSSTNTPVGKKSQAEEILYKIFGFCLLLEKKKKVWKHFAYIPAKRQLTLETKVFVFVQWNQRWNCQHLLDLWKSKSVSEKHLFLLYWLCQSL